MLSRAVPNVADSYFVNPVRELILAEQNSCRLALIFATSELIFRANSRYRCRIRAREQIRLHNSRSDRVSEFWYHAASKMMLAGTLTAAENAFGRQHFELSRPGPAP